MTLNLKFVMKLFVVTFMGITTFFALNNAVHWAGDWLTLLWICSAFFFPFLVGIMVGKPIIGRKSEILGSFIGFVVVIAPGWVYLATGDRNYVEHSMQNFYIAFVPLAIVQGFITMPVGVAARIRIQS